MEYRPHIQQVVLLNKQKSKKRSVLYKESSQEEANSKWFWLNNNLSTKIFQISVSFLITYLAVKELKKHPFVGALQNKCS